MSRTLRSLAAATLAAALILTTTPAWGAEKPGRMGLVSFVGASLTPSGATLSIDWASTAGATQYQVFASTTYSGVAAQTEPVLTTTGSAATLTGLKPGVDYFVQVRGVNAAGIGPRSNRVGHGTIAAEASGDAILAAPAHRIVSWNMCSVQCGDLATRAKAMHKRVAELAPGVIVLQEASRITVAPAGFGFAVDGQNDILCRSSEYSLVRTGERVAKGEAVFASKYATKGKGVAWAALRHIPSGSYLIVLDVHLLTGTSASATAQREYEASRIAPYVGKVVAALKSRFPAVTDWSKAGIVVAGDFNTNKSREGDDTTRILRSAGWYDAYDQARRLSGQHRNTANPRMQTTPVVGVTWGDHVDKILVRPSRSTVESWANGGKMASGRYVAPLPSDHHPLVVVVRVI